MLIEFFLKLKEGGVPVSIKEFLTLIEALAKRIAFGSMEEKKLIESLGGWDKLLETLKKRLAEQKGRHQGGGKRIGTAGTSPYGAWGYNPEGVRTGQPESLHNFLYERVWRDNRRRATERMATWQVLHTYPHDYKVILVGDATMSPYEIAYPGGSVEHTNEEAGAVWLQRLLTVYSSAIWLNPQPEPVWDYHESIGITRRLMGDRKFPLTLEGLDRGMGLLTRTH